MMKKFVLLMGITVLALAGCSNNEGNTGTAKLIVGMECAYAPYNWTTSTATATSVDLGAGQHCDGFDVMVARRVSEELGMEFVVEKIAWDGLIPSLQTNQIDAIIAGMAPTEERKKEIAFSNIYYSGTYGLVIKKDSVYATGTTVNDFTGAKVTAQLSTFHVDLLLPQLTGITELEPMKNFPTMTVAVKAGEIDAFISGETAGRTIEKENSDLMYLPLTGTNGFQVDPTTTGVAIGLRKNDEDLQQAINDVLASISEDEMKAYMDAAMENQQ